MLMACNTNLLKFLLKKWQSVAHKTTSELCFEISILCATKLHESVCRTVAYRTTTKRGKAAAPGRQATRWRRLEPTVMYFPENWIVWAEVANNTALHDATNNLSDVIAVLSELCALVIDTTVSEEVCLSSSNHQWLHKLAAESSVYWSWLNRQLSVLFEFKLSWSWKVETLLTEGDARHISLQGSGRTVRHCCMPKVYAISTLCISKCLRDDGRPKLPITSIGALAVAVAAWARTPADSVVRMPRRRRR